ncbi:MAG: sugar ABC transporter substrate-binding protein [Lachnospiraceae bacterium]|nr:sugar ABC transporter substrate-binding protein [Lachnospiraceae bacterium]
MKKKFLALAMMGIMAVTMMTGCGAVQTDSQVAASASDSTAEAVEAAAGKDFYTEDIKIAFLPNVIGDSCAAAWADGMKAYLDTFSNVTFDVYDGEASVDTEVQIMDELINQSYDAIILQATDAAGLAASVDKAEAAGIPVITCNLDADTTHTALVAGVDTEAGEAMANSIGESLGGEGKVVIISATPGATKGENIDAGFKAVLSEKYPNIEILDEQSGEWLTENANTVMNDFLTKYPEIDAVMCHNDAMAEGAAEAVKAAGRLEQVQIWGCDGESKMLDYIEEGLCTGTIYTNCQSQGASCAQMAVFAIESGITAKNLTSTPVVKMAPVIVTKDNLSDITEDMRW